MSYNKENDNESDQIRSADVRSDDRLAIMQAYEEKIKENIDYDGLTISHPLDKDLIQGIYELILEDSIVPESRNPDCEQLVSGRTGEKQIFKAGIFTYRVCD